MTEPLEAICLPRSTGIAHGFFTRAGGRSRGIYQSLNCGFGSKDDRADVAANRAAVALYLGVRPENLVTANQVHSARVVTIAAPWPANERPDADAIVTATPGLAIAALTADCAPILFADPEAKIVAAAHAGWRGALDGVVAATISAMLSQGARRERIRAILGPCISQAAYEVGPEFKSAFVTRDKAYSQYFAGFGKADREHFDLPAFVIDRLKSEHLARVENQTRCTYQNPDQFYSFRRATHLGEIDYGRQISAIVVT